GRTYLCRLKCCWSRRCEAAGCRDREASASITSAGPFSPLGPQAHLPLIEVKISGPHGAGQYLRRALSACFLDFDHYRCRVDFRLCLSARCGNVIESGPESINPNCSLQSKFLSRLPVSATHAP